MLLVLSSHGLKEDVFQSVAAMADAAQLQAAVGGQLIDVAHFDILTEDHLDAPTIERGALASQLLCRVDKTILDSICFELEEAFVQAALFFEVGNVDDLALLQDHYFFTRLLDVT